jgi:hypothetical protein
MLPMSRSTYGDCHGLRGASLLPAGPQTGQPGPKQPVGGMGVEVEKLHDALTGSIYPVVDNGARFLYICGDTCGMLTPRRVCAAT